MALEYKYDIKVKSKEKAIRTPKESIESLKGVLSAKKIANMKKEGIDCPIKNHEVSFVECFSCLNFMRRVKGAVFCKGEPLND